MKLTESQKLALINLNQEFKHIIKQQQQEPGSFDNHVNCLKDLEKILGRLTNLMSPYISLQINQGEKLLHAKWNIFKQVKIKHNLGEYKKIIKEINSLVLDDDLKKQMKLAFEGKPVTGFDVHIDDKEQTTRNYRGTFFEHSHLVTYKINFFDGTELTWHSLEDEKEMKKARQIFEEKVPQPKKEITYELTNTLIKDMQVKEATEGEENLMINTDNDSNYRCVFM
ncbi:TPA: hypothetical protein JAN90_07435 [Legionella pneumophila]|uniref:hypothetical protein n=1 Tax=Legionella sp. PATHC039 TaxID=2992042 RepID=UPI0007785CE7|nr:MULTISPECIES: hypothetical protein [Legionella]HAT8858136.1 hypothetical protein [Legionella pneumophila subsp. pneumophila]MCW8396824.1 hypothetical protein [Legionella sp. PATHC039]HAT7072604.1 hypothetical protein [Legionella pneumophila]HAT8640675.1 hypothetical protein [Legionella pneumophila]HAT8867461.1 hypothetical protein [Legionella pneumophila subsp. pneumophila]